jgi:hypothetical protein
MLVGLMGTAAAAQASVTVTSLLEQGAEVKGVIPTSAGPGILLQVFPREAGGDDRLYLCFVAETPTSEAVDTQYCKPVR